jgi:DNA-binding beta-propeller fold protein YncE
LLFLDENISNIYLIVPVVGLAYIWPTNQTIPPNGISYTNCSLEWLYYPAGITVDSVGNVYFSSTFCNWVTKWAPKAASGTLVAGSPIGVQGSDNPSLWGPHALALDEPNSFIYVADMGNNRIQRFVLGGSGIGVTVAGGNGQGSANNQLNQPIGIFLSRLDGSLYIADTYNNRIQK